MTANVKKKKYRQIKKVMSAGHTGLLFNIVSSRNTFPSKVKYEQNSEERDGNKNFFFRQSKSKDCKLEAGEV